tara:strand:+ start:6461 stop:7390 length:930 start_codon:yes stop_codon:yes gene_type:complete
LFKNKRYILITGGAGFIPSSLADSLLKDSRNFVVILDNLLTGDLGNVPVHDHCQFIEADVNNFNDLHKVMNDFNFDFVFHYAAVVGVQRTLNNPLLVLKDIDGIKNILELCVLKKIKKIFFSSSSEVYGEPIELPMNEVTTPLNSRLPYAIVKNIGEAYVSSYGKEYGLNYTIMRFFNTYGPKQSNDFVVSKFIDSALKNKDLTIYGNGEQSRTFCYIKDNLDFTTKCLENNLLNNEIVNVGNEVIISIKELASIIIDITDSSSKIIHLPELKEGDMFSRQPEISKMKKVLNRDLINIHDGIIELLKNE